jgi:CO dehydrogenase nickel-insertion accessory protein CooC1
MKVVYDDAGVNKVARGTVEFVDEWVKVIDKENKTILINRKNVIFIREE